MDSVGRFFLFFCWPVLAHAQDTTFLPLLGLNVKLVHEVHARHDVLLYNMHDNENTSASAGRIMARKRGGDFFELMHTGRRPLSFEYKGDSVHIDPNRIYTDAGLWLQLQVNRKPDTTLFRILRTWRDTLLNKLDIHDRTVVIALHNNTDHRYSFTSYLPGEEYAAEAFLLHPGLLRDPDDFFFVADAAIMDTLSVGRWPAVLQNNMGMTDDGSLSVLCGQLGIPYINVEAQHGHLLRQLLMLGFLYGRLGLNTMSQKTR